MTFLFAGCEEKKEIVNSIVVSSPAFGNYGSIPAKYTCDGLDISPPLNFSNIPENTKSLALVMYDLDATLGTFYHWLIWNIPPNVTGFLEGEGIAYPQGINDFGVVGYRGPCPPSGTHHYHFKVYALDVVLDLENGATREELDKAMSGHVLAIGELIGTYGR
ncbi:MAG: YbhB/YbcL family Raf kinase inhibitor-like protein [Thermoplasmata archaeon]|nr:YbhB/YbcL family Raf kinase inhibitor-like protein [Thermoplasmata archaeon]